MRPRLGLGFLRANEGVGHRNLGATFEGEPNSVIDPPTPKAMADAALATGDRILAVKERGALGCG